MTSASGGRNRVAHHCKVGWCRLVKTLENQQTDLALQATILRVWVGGYTPMRNVAPTLLI